MGRLIENHGETMDKAILVLETKNFEEALVFEYLFLKKRFGLLGHDYHILNTEFVFDQNQQSYHYFLIFLKASKVQKKIYFYIDTAHFNFFNKKKLWQNLNQRAKKWADAYQHFFKQDLRKTPCGFWQSDFLHELCKDIELS